MPEENEDRQKEAAPDEEDAAAEKNGFSYELSEPRWSVVTFEKCVAQNLTYDEAFQVLERLMQENQSGVCIVTDEAAARIAPIE